MIYMSTAWLQTETQEEAVEYLVENGFKNIELSGGKQFDQGSVRRLIELKRKYGLNYICHNYFFDQPFDYAINLASLNNEVYRYSLDYLGNALAICKHIGARKYGIHAGFLMDIPVRQLGHALSRQSLYSLNESLRQFCRGFKQLQEQSGDIELYVENNVLSDENLKTYNGGNPLLLVDYEDYITLSRQLLFRLLLDVGHLKVSVNSLGLDFDKQLDSLIVRSDYLHISDNDGRSDQNNPLTGASALLNVLRKYDLHEKTVTLEINGHLQAIKETGRLLEENAA
jgi:sugar phosphate isomerase/epimerase